MRQQRSSDGINFYRGYRQLVNSQKSGRGRQRARVIAPLAVLLAVMLGVSAVFLVNNRQKSRELAEIGAQMERIRPDYEQAAALAAERERMEGRSRLLQSSRFLFTVYPPLTQELFDRVRACAGDVFNISAYAYEEGTRTLVVDASADSVNEVPLFVERLRETELFERVQYTGYTSENEKAYFCTVGCTLGFGDSAGNADGEG